MRGCLRNTSILTPVWRFPEASFYGQPLETRWRASCVTKSGRMSLDVEELMQFLFLPIYALCIPGLNRKHENKSNWAFINTDVPGLCPLASEGQQIAEQSEVQVLQICLREQSEPWLGLLLFYMLLPVGAGWCWLVLVAICRMNSQHGSHALRQPTSASKTLASNQLPSTRMQIIIQDHSIKFFEMFFFWTIGGQKNRSWCPAFAEACRPQAFYQWNWEVSLAEHALRSKVPNRESNRITYEKQWKNHARPFLGHPAILAQLYQHRRDVIAVRVAIFLPFVPCKGVQPLQNLLRPTLWLCHLWCNSCNDFTRINEVPDAITGN